MTPPVSQGFGCWGLTSTYGITRTDATGARELTGIVDLTRGKEHPTARLLDLVPGRSGTVYKNWLEERGEDFRAGCESRRWTPSRDTRTPSTTSSKTPPASWTPSTSSNSLATLSMRYVAASSKTRPVTAGARGIPSIKSGFFCAPRTRRLTPRQQERLREAFVADEAHISVEVAYLLTQQVRDVFHQDTPTHGRRLAAHLIESLPACPIPEIARLGADPTQVEGRTRRLLRHRRSQQRTQQKPSTDIIELGRRTARGYRNPTNYQLRMLLIAGGLDASTHTQL